MEENEPLDRYLGRAEMEGCKVKEKVKKILSKPSSKPNILHKSLVEIFSDPSTLRIVTTNFDLHFETPISERWPDAGPNIYYAPALPQGGEFSGLLYLHGSLRQPAQMVLTDQDFGKAYLTRGWARRFLQDLFEAYVVLFVGYSHQDSVMNYLARGLPPRSTPTRYVVTDSNDRRWNYLGIEPIVYESDKTHSRLQEFSRVWATYSRQGVLERETQIQQIVKGDPQVLTKGDADGLLYALERPMLAQYFFRHAEDPRWIDWADSNGILNVLFSSNKQDRDLPELAEWFCRDLLGSRGSAAARIAALRQEPFHPSLWKRLSREIWLAAKKYAERTPEQSRLLALWVSLLMGREPAGARDWEEITYLLEDLILPQESEIVLGVLRFLTSPVIQAEAGFLPQIRIRHEISVRGNRYWLEHFEERLKGHMELLSEPILWIAISNLDYAHRQLCLLGSGSEDVDPLSSKRMRVDQKNSHLYDPILALVDIARIAIDWLAENRPQFLAYVLLSFVEGRSPLVSRICIYGLQVVPTLAPKEKIKLIINRRWLERRLLKTETFDLIARCYPQLSEGDRREFLAAAEEGFRQEDGRLRESNPDLQAGYDSYEMLELLAWLEKAAPSCGLVKQRLAVIRSAHPELPESEPPDLYHRSTGATRALVRDLVTSPYSADEMRTWKPEMFLDRFAELSENSSQRQLRFEPFFYGYLEQVATVVSQEPDLGLSVGLLLAQQAEAESLLWTYLFRGWSQAREKSLIWDKVLQLVCDYPHVIGKITSHAIAELLMELIRDKKNDQISMPTISRGIEVAHLVVSHVSDEVAEEFDGNWFETALNRSRGIVALFGLRALETVWIGVGRPTGWKMPDSFSALFELLLETSPFGRAVLGGYPHFLFDCDEVWTREKLIPLFSLKENAEAALHVWSGFLSSGRLNPLARVALLPHLVPLLDGFGGLTNSYLRTHLPSAVAWFAYLDDKNPVTWLRRFLATSGDTERASFTDQITSILREMTPEQRRELWKHWLMRYFRGRLEDAPRIENKEKVSFLEWCQLFPAKLVYFVGYFTKSEPPEVRPHQLYELLKTGESFSSLEAFARLLLWILEAQKKEGAGSYRQELYEFLEKLKGEIDNDLFRKLVTRYSELGGPKASTLLEEGKARND